MTGSEKTTLHFIKHQPPGQVINISDWDSDVEYYEGFYPQGARAKHAVISHPISQGIWIKPNFRYMFKESFERYPDQFWAEIIAYKVACAMKIHVPPTFVAFDGNKCGALIEWFYDEQAPCFLRFIDGGVFFQRLIEDFDIKKGTQHNFETMLEIFQYFQDIEKFQLQEDWFEQLSSILLLDTIIGNTDRHQENWGVIVCKAEKNIQKVRLAPAFDNGTSLGHEIMPENFHKFRNPMALNKYINKGTHHLRKLISSEAKLKHFDLIELVRPTCKKHFLKHLQNLNLDNLRSDLLELQEFKIPVPISKDRLLFSLMLIEERYNRLKKIIETD